jgi:hypothetical protein
MDLALAARNFCYPDILCLSWELWALGKNKRVENGSSVQKEALFCVYRDQPPMVGPISAKTLKDATRSGF